MAKMKKQAIGGWMSRERLQQKHAELERELQIALAQVRPDQELIKRLKRDKLTCKDLIAHKQQGLKKQKPSAEVVALPKRGKPAESLFFGTPRAAGFAVNG